MNSSVQQKIVTHLWFENQAEEAVNFYVSLFPDSKIRHVARYSDTAAKMSGQKPGNVMNIDFELNGQEFFALNGGSHFKFNEAISLVIRCKNQKEVDYYWDRLEAGGQAQMCGWLKDRYGLSWQVIPDGLEKLMSGEGEDGKRRSAAVMSALLQMKKLDMDRLNEVYSKA